MTVRRATKQVLEKVLRLARGNPGRMAGRSLILAYHNVVPDELAGRGDRSLHLPLSSFLRQVDLLEAHCEVHPLADLLIEQPAVSRPRIAITFDDAYRGAVDLALRELSRRGLPSTLFVAPGLLGQRSFWWDELADGPQGLSTETRNAALEMDAGWHEKIRAARIEQAGVEPLPDCYGCAGEDELRIAGALAGVTFGPHSWSHPNLTRISESELAAELGRPLEWLRATTASTVPILAYPYGLASSAVEQAVQRDGYTAALLVQGGWMNTGARHPWATPRYNVPAGLSVDGLMLRLSGHFTS